MSMNQGLDPPAEVIQLLNEVDMGYVGHAPINKPVATFVDESQEDRDNNTDWEG